VKRLLTSDSSFGQTPSVVSYHLDDFFLDPPGRRE
jgi:hypothetical protein